MKLVLIIILVIQISLIKPNTAQNETSSESKVATSYKSNKTTTQIERHIPETSLRKRTKLVVTRRPPINVHRSKFRGVKKVPLMKKIHNSYKTVIYIKPKNLSLTSHTGKPILHHDKHIVTKPNKYVNNSIINKINTTDNLNEDKNEPKKKKEQTEFVCNGPEMMNIVSQAKIVDGKEKVILNSSKLKDLRKLRKCLLRLQGLENAVSNNKRKPKRKNRNFKSNDKDAMVNIGSSEYELNGNKYTSIIEFDDNVKIQPIGKSFNEGKVTDNIEHSLEKMVNIGSSEYELNGNKYTSIIKIQPIGKSFIEGKVTDNIEHSLAKRQINIIEEESVGTTSSGFKFTGRDLLHTQLLYRNIHN